MDDLFLGTSGGLTKLDLEELGLAGGHHNEPKKGKVVAKSLGVVREVVIGAFRSKEDEAAKNAAPSVPLVANSSQFKGDTLEIDINTSSKESGLLLEKDSFRLEIALPSET
ncbi:hypothetical protein PVL29_015391 [Vitis rotundifolia]|uniref:Uncharacterized protein n=1 Tax=Vitis rotundifolia TaxID=103349 RepID=A0AA39DLJ5_VITRO|nr:hypothetical protein PVL29_015391 [Vitis rotundifolia]